jgi:hypothetical protein
MCWTAKWRWQATVSRRAECSYSVRADRLALRAGPQGARVLLLGGAAMDGPRHLFWNFVSSSRERIEQAKEDWKAGRFGKVPGDEAEFIPLPDGRVTAPTVGGDAQISEGSPTS